MNTHEQNDQDKIKIKPQPEQSSHHFAKLQISELSV